MSSYVEMNYVETLKETLPLLTDEEAAQIGRYLRYHLARGAIISAIDKDKCLIPMGDGTIYGGLQITLHADVDFMIKDVK